MINRSSRNYLRSRNTLIIFSILFLVMTIAFKFFVGFIVENIIIYTGTIMESGKFNPSIFEIGWDKIDLTKLNPMLWKVKELKQSINSQLHEIVDLIAPALVNIMSMVLAQSIVIKKSIELTPMLLTDYPDLIIK